MHSRTPRFEPPAAPWKPSHPACGHSLPFRVFGGRREGALPRFSGTVRAKSSERPRFLESLQAIVGAPRDHEASAARVGARASWTAATESSESPLWLGIAVLAARFGILTAARAKAVTSRTPSPQSKTWRQIRRFLERTRAEASRRKERGIAFGLLCLAFLILFPCSAHAHKPSDSYL